MPCMTRTSYLEHLCLDTCGDSDHEQAEEEKKPRDGVTPLSHAIKTKTWAHSGILIRIQPPVQVSSPLVLEQVLTSDLEEPARFYGCSLPVQRPCVLLRVSHRLRGDAETGVMLPMEPDATGINVMPSGQSVGQAAYLYSRDVSWLLYRLERFRVFDFESVMGRVHKSVLTQEKLGTRAPAVATREAWSWEQYLKEQEAVAAPVELFSKEAVTPGMDMYLMAIMLSQQIRGQSFPERENGFQVGMRLEGIDPRHPSVFCVLSVAEVCGYRLRLHFDGYLSCYDFWTNAGSPDIHPVGWCEKTKHELHIPKGYRKDKFVWMDHFKACKLQNAPKKLFRNRNSNGPIPKEFQVGMKLEAVDRKNPSLVCVATVADIVGDRLLVHFDNWDDSYDYWCDVNSPYVQPVGWCQEHGRTLIAPQDRSYWHKEGESSEKN
ncbi:hypothetical protein E2I00_018928 [Balaenoptera physalus]|uniref:Uncharacterized protein n=1 Tax=Balaenoptera physalus TaxID=9770 RepID=A0A6A1QA71_BALPH|nr:hypothetical protein E2I00_018928 [Balaenoptera physalus]